MSDAVRLRATALGFGAILSWAVLALLTVWSGRTPPFQLAALCFAVGAAVGLVDILRRGAPLTAAWRHPGPAWLLGVGGIFGYHFFYFTALRNAPPAEAGLIAYLWPLLIVLFSGLLPGERLRAGHLIGAVLAFAGAALLIAPEIGAFSADSALGYAAACVCALTWSSYSVLSRRMGATPTDAVAGFCVVAAALAALCHVALEETHWPADAVEWAAVLGLGLGPVGGAFYLWDIGVKRGDIQLLGVAAYAAPLLSTFALVAAGVAPPTLSLLAAAALIAGGAAVAAMAGRRAAA